MCAAELLQPLRDRREVLDEGSTCRSAMTRAGLAGRRIGCTSSAILSWGYWLSPTVLTTMSASSSTARRTPSWKDRPRPGCVRGARSRSRRAHGPPRRCGRSRRRRSSMTMISSTPGSVGRRLQDERKRLLLVQTRDLDGEPHVLRRCEGFRALARPGQPAQVKASVSRGCRRREPRPREQHPYEPPRRRAHHGARSEAGRCVADHHGVATLGHGHSRKGVSGHDACGPAVDGGRPSLPQPPGSRSASTWASMRSGWSEVTCTSAGRPAAG